MVLPKQGKATPPSGHCKGFTAQKPCLKWVGKSSENAYSGGWTWFQSSGVKKL
jgi:hypothetical protein